MRRLLLALLIPISCALAGTGTVKIHVMNGKSGKPVTNAHVLVFQGESIEEVKQLKHSFDLRTDADGIAMLPGDAMPWLGVLVDWHHSCQSELDSGIYRLATIQEAGLATPNTCSSIVKTATPGELYLFVRAETLLEKMRH
ncbi:MAG TPA: hypothetical protein VGN17_24835 [Bryobacteraceae bacterium]|jgi:uncharacterized protein YceK